MWLTLTSTATSTLRPAPLPRLSPLPPALPRTPPATLLPGCGAFDLDCLFACTDNEPTSPSPHTHNTPHLLLFFFETGGRYYLGKPNSLMIHHALERLGCHRHSACIVGDRMDTDIICGSTVVLAVAACDACRGPCFVFGCPPSPFPPPSPCDQKTLPFSVLLLLATQ